MDDDQLIRTLAGRMLAVLGYEAEMAEHGAKAIEKYRSALRIGRPFDVVILDLTVRRGAGGIETIEELRRLDPDVKAVISSGYVTSTVMLDCQLYGFRGRLAKPYRLEEVSSVLDSVLTEQI